MRFPTYWSTARNKSGSVSARGWSDSSQAEAQKRAENRLERILAWLSSKTTQDLDRYSYLIDDNICEVVVDRVLDENDQEIAVISRNAYGALVLNAANVMFVDIDFEPVGKATRPGLFARLLGAKAPRLEVNEQAEVEKIRQWQIEHPQFTLRVYRTAGGLRAIVTNQIFPEVDRAVIDLMDSLNSDPLYRELCIAQKCFRARLTAKPWRIGIKPSNLRFPFQSDEHEQRFQQWFAAYMSKCKDYSVCRLIEQFVVGEMHPSVVRLIELHDRLCCSSDGPLA